MTDVSTVDRPKTAPARVPVPDGAKLVSGYKLAAHFGMSRQNVDTLAAQGVLTRRSDGLFDQDANRLAYLQHLRSDNRRSPRTVADTEHTAAKAALLRIRIAEKKRDLIPLEEAISTTDEVIGLMLVHMSGMAARCSGPDLQLRRRIERVVYETRVAMSEAANKLADQRGEPPLGDES